VDPVLVSQDLRGPSLEELGAILIDFFSFSVDDDEKIVEVKIQGQFGFVPPFLDDGLSVGYSSFQSFQNAHILSALQFRQGDLLVHNFHALDETFDCMGGMFLTCGALETKYLIVA
jgi:hypothetical protein